MLALLDLDPNIVKPGWTPLLITIALAAVMVLLFFSIRKQFRRIDVSQFQPTSAPDSEPSTESTSPAPPAGTAAETEPAEGPGPKV